MSPRLCPTTQRIALMTSFGWSSWMRCPRWRAHDARTGHQRRDLVLRCVKRLTQRLSREGRWIASRFGWEDERANKTTTGMRRSGGLRLSHLDGACVQPGTGDLAAELRWRRLAAVGWQLVARSDIPVA